MKKWNMIIDVAECTNCNLCTLAAMDEYVGNDWPGYSRADAEARPQVDQHSAEGARADADDRHRLCSHHVQPLRRRALHEGRQDRRDQESARTASCSSIRRRPKGAKQLVDACPYGHIWWNEDLQLPQAWTFDAHLIDQGWQQTRGQQSCPTGAMRAIKVEDADMARMAREQNLEVMRPELGIEAAGLLPQSVALFEMLHRRHAVRGEERRRRLRRGRERAARQGRRVDRGDHDRQLRRFQIRQARREFRPLHSCRSLPAAAPRASRPISAPASISAKSGYSGRVMKKYLCRISLLLIALVRREPGANAALSVAASHAGRHLGARRRDRRRRSRARPRR